MSDTEKFQLVTYRRKAGKSNRGIQHVSPLIRNIEETEIDCKVLLRKILDAEIELKNSSLRSIVFNSLANALNSICVDSISEIICYGLGRFSQSRCSKYQLALLLSIKTQYNCPVFIYDPLFYKREIQILKTLEFNIIENNEEGKRNINNKGTLLFMPHCSKQLTNNLLYTNWGQELNNCIFLANSFSDIIESNVLKDLSISAEYILKIHPYATELSLENNFEYEDIFNGLNIHFFTKENLNKAPRNFWNKTKEPCYQEDIEFIKAVRR